jgi:hypothetical protein
LRPADRGAVVWRIGDQHDQSVRTNVASLELGRTDLCLKIIQPGPGLDGNPGIANRQHGINRSQVAWNVNGHFYAPVHLVVRPCHEGFHEAPLGRIAQSIENRVAADGQLQSDDPRDTRKLSNRAAARNAMLETTDSRLADLRGACHRTLAEAGRRACSADLLTHLPRQLAPMCIGIGPPAVNH